MPIGIPGWPLLAASTASTASIRSALHSSVRATGSGCTWAFMRTVSLLGASFQVDQPQDHGGKDELHREPHLAAGDDDVVWATHPRVVQHRYQIWEVDALGVGEANHHHRFIRGRDIARDERITRVHR